MKLKHEKDEVQTTLLLLKYIPNRINIFIHILYSTGKSIVVLCACLQSFSVTFLQSYCRNAYTQVTTT